MDSISIIVILMVPLFNIEMILRNKTTAIILAILTFILGSILLTSIIFYLLGYPLSSLAEHQIEMFSAILVSAFLASMVYSQGPDEQAIKVAKILDNSLAISVEEKDISKILKSVQRIPPFVVNKYVSLNINLAEELEEQISDYKDKLTDDDLLKIRKIIETPVEELQTILNELYLETNIEQFKIMADPKAKPLIDLNVRELRRILFDE